MWDQGSEKFRIEQIQGLFNKNLPGNTFEYLRNSIKGKKISQIDRIHPREGVLRFIFLWYLRRYLHGIFIS